MNYASLLYYTWLFGAFSPITGDDFLMEFPVCNTDTFQIFLNEFSAENPKTLIMMVLDNGAFHKAKKLKIPDNIKLVFLPPYSPELNPAEKMWARIKRAFTNKLFKSLEEISLFIDNTAKEINESIVKSNHDIQCGVRTVSVPTLHDAQQNGGEYIGCGVESACDRGRWTVARLRTSAVARHD
jgi:transposase